MSPAAVLGRRGDVFVVDFDPSRGHEQAGRRPALVLSVERFNRGGSGLVFVVPFTSRRRDVASHVEVLPPEGGLDVTSYAMCEQLRAATRERLVRRLGQLRAATLAGVEDRVRMLLGL